MLHHHTTAHYVNAFAREIATWAHVWVEGAHVELLHHLEAEIDQFWCVRGSYGNNCKYPYPAQLRRSAPFGMRLLLRAS